MFRTLRLSFRLCFEKFCNEIFVNKMDRLRMLFTQHCSNWIVPLYVHSFQEQVELLSQDELKELVCRMLEHQPGLVMTLLEKGNPEQGYHPEPSPSTKPNWCKCTNCREMPTERESKFCAYVTANCLSCKSHIDCIHGKQRNFKLKSTWTVSLVIINCICKTYFYF